jgi:preprotein translocase subunit SecG
VKSGGINRVTMTLAVVFCASALVINATWNV